VLPEPVRLVALVAGPATTLSLDGALTRRSIPACRQAIDDLTTLGVRVVRLDLQRTRVDRDGPAVLILMRRYGYRHGISLTLRNAPGSLVDTLARARLGPLYGTAAPDPTEGAHTVAGTTPGQAPRTASRPPCALPEAAARNGGPGS
jgi:ABC-type transporter Mla MlaB component